MKINTPILDQIHNLSIHEVIGKYDIELKPNGSTYLANCPFHKDKTPSFTVYPNTGSYYCFGCHVSGDAIAFVEKYKSVKFLDAVRMIAKDHNIEIPEEKLSAEEQAIQKHREELFIVNQWATKWFINQLKENSSAIDYLKNKRKWSDESISTFQIGYAPNGWHNFLSAAKNEGYKEELLLAAGLIKKKEGKEKTYDFFRNRIMFPIHNHSRRVCGFAGRSLTPIFDKNGNEILKYINTCDTEIYAKKEILFGLHDAKRSIEDKFNVYVVEGNPDVIRLKQIGIPNCVGISGSKITQGQIDELKKITSTITIIPDMDPPKADENGNVNPDEVTAGEAGGDGSAKLIIENGLHCKIIQLPKGTEKNDADSFFTDKAQFDAYEKATRLNYIYYLAQKDKNNHQEEDQKHKLISKIVSMVQYLPEVAHEDYFTELGKLIPPKSAWKKNSITAAAAKKEQKGKREQFENNEYESKKILPFVEVQNVLNKWYDLRFNEITHQVEGRLKEEQEYKVLNENSVFVRLLTNGHHISLGNLCALLNSDFLSSYNPIRDYFTNLLDWEKTTDYITMLSNHIKAADQNQFNNHFKKMLIRTIACALDEQVFNKHAFILVGAEQGTGKSSFCRYLCPAELTNYIAESIPNDKDGQIALTQNFIINLDELSTLSKFEINHLKSLFSKDRVKVRHPFAKKSQADPRICSFVGSTNEDTFLSDSTGSVRWLCFEIAGIDKDENKNGKNYRNVPINMVWSQAYSLYKSGVKYQLSAEEIRENEKRNQQYQKVTLEFEAVQTWLKPGNETDNFMLTQDILKILRQKTDFQTDFKIELVGKALKTLGFVRKPQRIEIEFEEEKQPRRGYYVKY
jgi:DNA primase catalytic core